MADKIKEESARPRSTCPLSLMTNDSSLDHHDESVDHNVPVIPNPNYVHDVDKVMHKNNITLKKSDVDLSHPFSSKNGIAIHREKVEIDHQINNEAFCDVDSLKLSNINAMNLLEASSRENCKKQGLDIECVDSGVHSGTENGSDAKSSSSSPGLSTESSVHDLSDKKNLSHEDLSKSIELCNPNVTDSNSSVDQLADDVSKAVTLSTDDATSSSEKDIEAGIEYVVYESELQMPDIMQLITKDLSEPYSIYTYRYFIHNWPKLCFLAMDESRCVGAIVCKLDLHKKMVRRGYIAMLAVDQNTRRKGIGSHLVLKAIGAMMNDDCDEVVLETEITNKAALRLYENLGFVRDKRLFRYYLNGVDALRLKLWLR